jgi:hypothetical protein
MKNTALSRHIGFVALGCGLSAALLYAVMIGVTLAQLEAVSGHVPFDMRPLGYRPAEAATLLDALGGAGRAYYVSRQIPLDMLYPALLALTLIATIHWFGQRLPTSRIVRLGMVLSVASAMLDYVENAGIAAMIWCWPELPAPLVHAASTATIAKSALTTSAVLLTVFIGLLWARRAGAGIGPRAREAMSSASGARKDC